MRIERRSESPRWLQVAVPLGSIAVALVISAIGAGVAHVPEDRLGTGVAPSLSIASNVVLKAYRDADVSAGPFLRRARILQRATALIARYAVQAPGPETRARDLSGGNLQKVVIGREFAGEPRVLVVAAPTRGLDVGAIENVHELLRTAAARGVAVLMISEDLDEILALADRVLVMYEGAIVGERAGEGADVDERWRQPVWSIWPTSLGTAAP